jgi:hypothetical protein
VLASAFEVRRRRASSDSTLAWWQRLGPSPRHADLDRPLGRLERLVRAAQAMRRDFFGIQYGARGDTRTVRYGRASCSTGTTAEAPTSSMSAAA